MCMYIQARRGTHIKYSILHVFANGATVAPTCSIGPIERSDNEIVRLSRTYSNEGRMVKGTRLFSEIVKNAYRIFILR